MAYGTNQNQTTSNISVPLIQIEGALVSERRRLSSELDRIDKAIEVLYQTIGDLEVRVDAICTPVPPSPMTNGTGSAPALPASPVVMAFRAQEERINVAIQRLQDVINRIEL